MQFTNYNNGDITIRVATKGSGPVILCVHGWPELWYSWRHQMEYFSKQGYRVAAMDVRGYGGSSKPHEISAYTIDKLASDVAAVAQQLSDKPIILFGHDWGAPVVWGTALRYPEIIRAVAGLSVPYLPVGDASSTDLFKVLYADRFFYQNYIQQEGTVEAEVEADIPVALRKIYFSLSGNAPQDDWLKVKPADANLLQDLTDPQPFPEWMSDSDMQVYVDAFTEDGMRGPFNRYRAQTQDFADSASVKGKLISQPTCFIGGSKDAVRHFIPGGDLFSDPGVGCEDYRGTTIIDGAGHWVQQEAPSETNRALKAFVDSL